MSVATEKEREMVLAVMADEAGRFFASKSPDRSPFIAVHELDVNLWLSKSTVAFLPRRIAERNQTWRHFATYAVLHDNGRYFTYRRGSSGSEDRLHGKLSLGVGGHVGIEDYGKSPAIDEMMLCYATLRELDEELDRSVGADWTFSGLIADDSSPVNRVHIGVVYLVECKSDSIKPRESCLAEPVWLTPAELHERRSEFETWSQIVIDHLIGGGA